MPVKSHPTAIIDKGAKIGSGSSVWHFSHISSGAKIGKNVSIGQNVFIGNDVKIGNGCKIQNNVSIFDKVTIEDDVFCGPSIVFTNVINPRAHISRKHEYKPTLIKKGVSLGANSTIICGNIIGEYSFVGAGCVVNKNILPFSIVVGVPCHRIGWICKCGLKLKNKSISRCEVCDLKYEITSNNCKLLKNDEKK